MKTSALTRYYLIYLIEIVLIWGVMSLVGIDFYFIIIQFIISTINKNFGQNCRTN